MRWRRERAMFPATEKQASQKQAHVSAMGHGGESTGCSTARTITGENQTEDDASRSTAPKLRLSFEPDGL